MTFLPIVGRELRVSARRRATYWNRLGIALLGLVIGGWIMLFPEFRRPQMLGIVMFVSLSVLALLYSGFAGVLTTADCLSEEKREGTMGLLFLTDLRGYDIVSGKLAASSLRTFYAMLALFPVMAIPLMVGGVTMAEFWRVVLVCVNTLFFSLALGMFCSAISRDERKSATLGILTMLFLVAGLPILAGLAHDWRPTRPVAPLLMIPSPGYASFVAFEETYRNRNWGNLFYVSVIFTHLFAWVLLLTASFIVPRTWHDKDTSPGALARRQKLSAITQGSMEGRTRARRRLLAINPFYWLTARDRFKSVLVWLVLGMGACIWLLGIYYDRQDWLSEFPYVLTGLIAHTVIKLWLATEACRRLAADRKSGALELLLVTPLSVGQIVRGQLRALVKQFGAPALVILVADFAFLMAGRSERLWVVYWAVMMIIFVADLLALSVVGMGMALRSRSVNRAAAATIVRILVLPWVLFAVEMTLFALMLISAQPQGNTRWLEYFPFVAGLATALLVDLFFGLLAWQRLTSGFRKAVTDRFGKARAQEA